MKILLDAIQFAHRAVDTVIVHGGLYDGDRCRLMDARDRLAGAVAKVLGVDEAVEFLSAPPDYRIDQPHPAVGVGAKPAKEDCPRCYGEGKLFFGNQEKGSHIGPCPDCGGSGERKMDGLQADLLREWEELPPMVLEIDRCTLCTILGALQLALRHPGLAATKGAAPRLRDFVDRVAARSGPAMQAAIRLGFDAHFDR